ncbi:MAG: hypothetical protein ACKVJK_01640 [Methylophagaceae bacterium]|jgi:hypothetical protein|tara:strand:+ start:318 stop:515 length:198 start_codon:yes stop_codon:yes gene_type:complete
MTKQWHGGKGSQQRKSDTKAYADNWDAIFGKKEEVMPHLKYLEDALEEIRDDFEKIADEKNEKDD